MKGTQFEFRFRVLIALILYVIGFWAPWTRYGAVAPDTTAWLALSTIVARLQWLPLNDATLLVTSAAIAAAIAGALVRIWGTAYLGTSVVHASAMQAGGVMADGPYRHVRNPLYIGTWLFSLGIAILMPPSGAVFFVLATSVFYFRLILGEEAYLAGKLGEPYAEYRQRVPRLLASVRARVPGSGAKPRWMESVLAEFYTTAFAGCFAVLAWDYDPRLLIRCLLVCFGISLVSRALLPGRRIAAE